MCFGAWSVSGGSRVHLVARYVEEDLLPPSTYLLFPRWLSLNRLLNSKSPEKRSGNLWLCLHW